VVTTLYANPLDSYEGYLRFHHLDVSALTDSELRDELYFLRPQLWGLPQEDWLRQRVQVLEAETYRRSRARQDRARPMR